jgi:hypothetical protein
MAGRGWPLILTLAAVAVSLPTVKGKLFNDDYCQRTLLTGPSPFLDRLAGVGLAPEDSGKLSTALSDQFIALDPEGNLKELKAYGALPWWACDDLRVAFWRPVAALTHWVDHRLFPNSIELMHLHSILWFAAVMLAVSLLYRRLIGAGGIAALAALMYLLADFSYFPTLWLANRNALICLFFGVATLILHDRYRSEGRRRWGFVAAPACLLLSLLSAEAGIATLAYLLAYEAILRRDRWATRLWALAPFALVIIGWRVAYNVLDYGASGGGFYLDPVREPLRYARAVLDRAPFFLSGQWTTLPPEFHSMLSGTSRRILWGALLLLAVAVPAGIWPFLRVNRRARFWLMGMHLSVLPVCATVPMSRALTFIAVGAFGLVAEYVGTWWQKADWVPGSGWWRRLTWALVAISLFGHLPWAVLRRAMVPKMTAKLERRLTRTMAISHLRWEGGGEMVVVNAPNPIAFLYDPFRNAYEGKLLPAGVRTLAPAFGALEVARTHPRRLTVRAVSRSLLDCPEHGWLHFVFFYHTLSTVRSADRPLQPEQRIVLPRLTVEVMRVDEHGAPVEVAFEFPVPLEDPSLQWISWNWQARDYVVFRVPGLGETVTLAGPFP